MSGDVVWRPHPGPQTDFFRRGEFEVFYGGAAGGGKTDALVIAALRYAWHPHYRGLLLRRTFPQLQEILDRTRSFYSRLFPGAEYRASEHRWYFPSGAAVTLGHMQHEDDCYNYQGKEFQFIGFDELPQFTGKQYLYLFSRARSVHPDLKPIIRATGNPGGVGHQFVKDRFRIGNVLPGTTLFEETVTPDTGEVMKTSRVFIPATVYDNPTLVKNDPLYIQRLMMLPEVERMRLLHGIWDAFEGQAFPELNREVHGVKDFEVPLEWERFRAFDWGYSKPFSVGWYAVDFDGILWRYAEWYGAKKDEGHNSWDCGLKMTATEIAREIKERERSMPAKVRPGPADPGIWSRRPGKDGILGISVADEMAQEGVLWIKADNDRILGRQQVHHRLKVDEMGKPGLYVFLSCEHWWRSMPGIREYEKNPEDVETKAEDHQYDETRYACMFKPIRPHGEIPSDVGSFQSERRKMIRARQHAARYGTSIIDAYHRTR